ncbi:Hpt domain-containing protein [Pseudolabrys sp. FHR47]|uniref:Hpt domain-containing protein n=1 Tax=Pseudolabrys sp. FHR47 TaxID=2562284 RepID=UPI0010BEBFB3|nr:Hpt domain-containing protein [Pseudolabrys sp. FHR47]
MRSKKHSAAITTYGDHEVIRPENKLRKALTDAPPAAGDDDPVAQAELALAGLSAEFGGWMNEECERLDRCRQTIVSRGVTENAKTALFHAAHDIKGQAATLGFPAVAAIADSLCRLIEFTPQPNRIPVKLISQHVDAVRAVHREYARSDAKALAAQLNHKLRDVTDHFLVEENRTRPDIIEQITGAPPLTPT